MIQHGKTESTIKVARLDGFVRWPTTVTAKSFSSRQNRFCHSKLINHFRHGKIILTTAKSFLSRQNHFRHGKIILATAKSFSSRQNPF